jgi:UDPglucose 6-dehydrogenase
VGTDKDAEKIASLRSGQMPFHEPGLDELVTTGVQGGRLRFEDEADGAIGEADVVFVCVGTPPRATGEANLIAVEDASRSVARAARGRTVVVEKSTVPAGTAQRVRRTLQLEGGSSAADLEVVSNPEFLREGSAVEDSLHPDRILVGAEVPWAFAVMRDLYRPMLDEGATLIETDINTAELAKHASNAFLALKISYANALARICERTGADVKAIADVMGADPRIGRAFLDAGLGYGGSCFPKDLDAFERLASQLHYDFPLIREVVRLNDEAMASVVDKVRDSLWNLETKRIAVLGLSFKPGTDDVRHSPALSVAKLLMDEGATVVGYDPVASSFAKEELPEIELAPDVLTAISGAHCLVLATDWPEFREIDMARAREVMAYPLVVDGRNMFDRGVMEELGFTYRPVGRAGVH